MLLRCRTIDAHAEGGPLRLLVEGVPPLAGATLAERAASAGAALGALGRALRSEPRGHRDLVLACFTVPDDASAHAAVIFLGEDGLIPWCGHGAIGALTIAIERGLLLVAREPRVTLAIESLAGVRSIIAVCEVPPRTAVEAFPRVVEVSYDAGPAEILEAGRGVACQGRLARVDLVAHDGGVWAVVDAESVGVPLAGRAREMARSRGRAWFEAIADSLASASGVGAALEGVVLTGPPNDAAAHLRTLSVFADGSIDVSPGGGATVAVATVLAAMGLVGEHQVATIEGVAGGRFDATVTRIEATPARTIAEVRVAGRAWITGEHLWHFQADDPLRAGQANDVD